MTCIDGNAFFIGGRNLCVSSKAFPILVGDTIIFHYRGGVESYLAQYHLSRGNLVPASDGSIIENAVPSPCSIIYHIYTYCYRQQWSVTCFLFSIPSLFSLTMMFLTLQKFVLLGKLIIFLLFSFRNKGRIKFQGKTEKWRVKGKWRIGVSPLRQCICSMHFLCAYVYRHKGWLQPIE